VTPEWLNENLGDYSQPWLAGTPHEQDIEKALPPRRKRQIWYKQIQTTLLQSPNCALGLPTHRLGIFPNCFSSGWVYSLLGTFV
jgi:hypothetical protein